MPFEGRDRVATGGPSVALLVEDDRIIGWDTEVMLQKLGVSVLTATSVSGAINLIENNQFDFALLDLDLCSGGGLQIARLLFSAGIPIILTTVANLELPDTVRFLRMLRKPYSSRDLERLLAPDGPIATHRGASH